MLIQIVLFHGFDELDVVAPFEVLKNATAAGADVQIALVALDDTQEITAAHGLQVRVAGRLGNGPRPDILIVPGGGWNNHAPQGARVEAQRGELPTAIARLHKEGTIIASVCTGGMLVAATGLSVGRPAITHSSAVEELRATGATIVNARVVDDGDLISSGGVTSGLDLALWLVERYFCAELALKIERQLEYERRGIVWHR
ncbi:MAG: DJ-1/PfpI family protein [Ktedonobacteraceae bacterium]